MTALIGIVVVLAAVFGGYALEDGPLEVLLQPAEYLIIWGAAVGSLVIAAPYPVIRRIGSGVKGVFRPSPFARSLYVETLQLLYELFQVARREGMLRLDRDIERPADSAIFKKYPRFLAVDAAPSFLTDTFRMSITGGVEPNEIDLVCDQEIELREEHELQPAEALATIADALPGLGIVAAVLGIVITMGSLSGPPEELGHKVAAALVGTFLGVFTCYGLVGPLAAAMQSAVEEEIAYLRVLRAGLIAFLRGHPPLMAAEFARRMIPGGQRPSFDEMERSCKKAVKRKR